MTKQTKPKPNDRNKNKITGRAVKAKVKLLYTLSARLLKERTLCYKVRANISHGLFCQMQKQFNNNNNDNNCSTPWK